MLGGDLVMDVDDCSILWMIFDVVWLSTLLCISYHTGIYSSIEITSFSWFMMIDDDSVVYLCRDASSGVPPKPLVTLILFDTLTILDGFTIVKHVFVHILNGVNRHDDFFILSGVCL